MICAVKAKRRWEDTLSYKCVLPFLDDHYFQQLQLHMPREVVIFLIQVCKFLMSFHEQACVTLPGLNGHNTL